VRIITLIISLVFSGTVLAFSNFNQTTLPPLTQGTYLTGGFGVGTISCINCGKTKHNTITHTLSAHTLDLGYQFNPYVALELDSSILQDFDVFSIITPGWDTPKSTEGNVVIKGILPLSNRFSLFGKIGPGFIWLSNRKDEDAAYTHESTHVAAGIAFRATKHVSAELSYSHYFAPNLVIDDGILSASILF